MQDNVVIESISGIPFGTVLAWVLGIVAILAGAIGGCVYLYKFIEKYRVKRNVIDDKHEQFEQIKSRMDEIYALVTQLQQNDNEQRLASIEIMKYQIEQACKYLLKKEECTLSEYKSLCDMFKTYSDIGGNGTAKELFELVEQSVKVIP